MKQFDVFKWLSQPIALAESRSSWIMVMPLGTFHHPLYGTLTFSRAKLAAFQRNFDARVRKIDIALDVDHKAGTSDSRAAGWIRKLAFRPAQSNPPALAGLYAHIAWTPYGRSLIEKKEYRYFSPEFGEYTDEISGKKYSNVLIGGALTNRPFLKIMPPVQLAEQVSWKPWGSIDKANLPAACFLLVGNSAKKSTWKLPIYEANNGKRGKLNGNAVKAAYAALHGARTGVPMRVPPAVRQTIERLYKKLFGDTTSMDTHTKAILTEILRKLAELNQGQDDEDAFEDVKQFFADRKKAGKAKKPQDDDDDDAEDDDEDGDEDEEENDPEDDDGADEDGDDGEEADEPKAAAKHRARHSRSHTTKRRPKKAFDPAMGKTLAEQQQRLAEMEMKLYENEIDAVLRGWETGKNLSFATTQSAIIPKTRDIAGVTQRRRTKVQLTPKSALAIRSFMLDEAFELDEKARGKLLDLIQTLLSESFVETGARGGSFDQESRWSMKDTEGSVLAEVATQLAAKDHKTLDDLSSDEQLAYYVKAEKILTAQ